jgi:hypothetical protein
MGWFRFYFDDQCWEWSEGVQRMHGHRPGTMFTPTTDVVLSHTHPDDRAKVATTIDQITHTRGVFSGRHRIIDTEGGVHSVVVIGDQFFNEGGAVIGTHGFYVEVTATEQAHRDEVDVLVGEIAESRGAIERAKGMLMLIYDLDAEAAFRLLIWLSQRNNTKLRVLAERVCVALRSVTRDELFDRPAFDHALMTAHQLSSEDSEAGEQDCASGQSRGLLR